MDPELKALSEQAGGVLLKRQLMLTCAESCTGGWVSAIVTATAGSSAWFERGFVTYSDAAKQELLGVRAETLAAHGAVSEATAVEMVEGALARSRADVALAITGIAGPAGGSPGKPVGTVCFAWCMKGGRARIDTRVFAGDRESVRRQSVTHALRGLIEVTEER